MAAVASQPQVYQQQPPVSGGPSTVSITPIQYQHQVTTQPGGQQHQVVQQPQQQYQQVQQPQQYIQQQTVQQQVVQPQPQPPAAHRASTKGVRKPLQQQQIPHQNTSAPPPTHQVQANEPPSKKKRGKNKKNKHMQAVNSTAAQNVQSGFQQNQQMQQLPLPPHLQPQQVQQGQQQQAMDHHIEQGGAIQVVTSYTGQSQYMIKRERVPASAVAALQSPTSAVNFKLNLSKEDEDFAYGPNSEGELHEGCRKCNVVYGSATELKLHFSATHNRQTFECFVCNKLFLQKFAFLAHIDRYHDDCGKSFPCQFCDKSYTNQNALDQHIGTYHKNPHLICPLCSKSFPQKFSLRRHIQNVHENSGKGEDCKHPFKCLTCGKSYKSQSGLTIHSKSKHQNTQYKCKLFLSSFVLKFLRVLLFHVQNISYIFTATLGLLESYLKRKLLCCCSCVY